MLQAAGLHGLSFDPVSLHQNSLSASEVDVGRCQVAQALVVTLVIVMRHKGLDLRLQITRQEVVLQQDAGLERLMPALDLEGIALKVRKTTPGANKPRFC
jgi:hypothetical protein